MADTNDAPLMPEPSFQYLVQTFYLQAMISAGKLPNFLSTHPSTPDRIDKVKQMIKDVRKTGKQ